MGNNTYDMNEGLKSILFTALINVSFTFSYSSELFINPIFLFSIVLFLATSNLNFYDINLI